MEHNMSIGKVYVASSLDRGEDIKKISNLLREKGIQITYDWTTHGRVYDPAALAEIALKEERGVHDCDVFFMVLPGGGGTHFEFGIARTLNKPIVIYISDDRIEQKSFYYLPGITKYDVLDRAINSIIELLTG